MRVPITLPISEAFDVSPIGLIIIPINLVGVTSANSQVSVMIIVFFKRIQMTTGFVRNSAVAARITHDSAPFGT